jgi:cell division GTPase FtsZ
MLKLKVVGCGAAGNKAAIQLIKNGFDKGNVTLVNSTARDIPEEYRSNAIIFGTADSLGGCGKERDMGKRLILNDMRSGTISLDGIIDSDTNVVVIVSSTEGGSGSAVTPIIAKYITEVLGIPVIVVLFFGFNSDVRGMQNSIEISQELSDDYGVIGISNAKFLESSGSNKIRAELAANDEFVKIIDTLSGKNIMPAEQNIDSTDLFKLITTPGYMCIGNAQISKVKNREQFNKAINEAIDGSKLLDVSTKAAKRIGVIFDIPENMEDNVDYNVTAIRSRYGTPYEMFTHIQHKANGEVTWIISGLHLPLEEVKEIYENYLRESSSVNKSKDSFYDSIGNLAGNKEDGMFNMLSISGKKPTTPTKAAKNSFFADFGIGSDK